MNPPLPSPVPSSATWTRAMFVIALALLCTGIASRTAPLLDVDGRLLRQFPTEDGYLMLTIARNIAIGNGMSVAAGEIATNGTQPLMTFVWAGVFRIFSGDRASSIALVLVIELLIALASAWCIFRFARHVLGESGLCMAGPALIASAWFASSVSVPHTMNCLETGFYALACLVCAWAFYDGYHRHTAGSWSVARSVGLGILLGVTFLARNDAVFFILGACLAHVAHARLVGAGFGRRLKEALIFGSVSVLVASPWLIYNYSQFGSIIPISGQAEALTRSGGGNADRIPSVLFEYLFVVLPLPETIQNLPVVSIGATIILCVALLVVAPHVWRNSSIPQRVLLLHLGIFATALCVYYGFSFGAGWFVNRYFFPLSPFLALLAGCTALRVAARRPRLAAPAAAAAGAVAVGLCVLLNLRLYDKGTNQGHFQVVDWVTRHVPEDVWVAATQTGTLGFFHDRTINLDGKVNPEALRALREGRTLDYALERGAQYIVDWEGHAHWIEEPVLAPHFELLVHDREANLAVLRRKGAPYR